VILVYLGVPWRYVFSHYVAGRGTPWHRLSGASASTGPR
jgi:hypothetical protein